MTAEFELGQNWANSGRLPLCEVMPDTLMGVGGYLMLSTCNNQSKSETIFVEEFCENLNMGGG